MVDKEMAATSAAIEDAVRRIEVRDGWGAGAPPVPWGLGGLSAGCTHFSPLPLCKGQTACEGQGGRGPWVPTLSRALPFPGSRLRGCPPGPGSSPVSLPSSPLVHSSVIGAGHDEPGSPCQLWGETGGE